MPVIYYPNDLKSASISYESFFLGSDLYITRVLESGQKSVEVYLPGPSQSYTHVWSEREYIGGQAIRVSAPYGKPAVFVVGRPKHSDLQGFLEFVRRENETPLDI